jgi:uncharacterized low-complexity protein
LARPFLAAALLIAAAPAAHAQIVPSSVQEISSAVKDCSAATTPAGISREVLASAGWSAATFSKDGKPVEAELGIYGKAKANPLIMTDLTATKPGTLCMVMARLNQPRDYQAVVDSLDALDNMRAVKKEGLSITFSNGKQIVHSDLTGSRDKPGVRIAVMAIGAGKAAK